MAYADEVAVSSYSVGVCVYEADWFLGGAVEYSDVASSDGAVYGSDASV